MSGESPAPTKQDDISLRKTPNIFLVPTEVTITINSPSNSSNSSLCTTKSPNRSPLLVKKAKELDRSNSSKWRDVQNGWYEEIQFKATYHHFRSSNYAAVLKSLANTERGSYSNITITHTSPQMQTEPKSSKSEDSPKRSSLCWGFPKKVRLPHLFSTKSLDDILKTSSSGSSEAKNPPKPPPSSSSEIDNFYAPPSPANETASSTDVKIYHKAFEYNFPKAPQVLSGASSGESETFGHLDSKEIGKNSVKKTSFCGSSNRVEPSGAKLVVATLGYFQRPISPLTTNEVGKVKSERKGFFTPNCCSRSESGVLEDFKTTRSSWQDLKSVNNRESDEENNFKSTSKEQRPSRIDNLLRDENFRCKGRLFENLKFYEPLKSDKLRETRKRSSSANPALISLGNSNKLSILMDESQLNQNPGSSQFVKRTAQLYNSKFSASQDRGCRSSPSTPSYLNVSRSISGYTCLAYPKSQNERGARNKNKIEPLSIDKTQNSFSIIKTSELNERLGFITTSQFSNDKLSNQDKSKCNREGQNQNLKIIEESQTQNNPNFSEFNIIDELETPCSSLQNTEILTKNKEISDSRFDFSENMAPTLSYNKENVLSVDKSDSQTRGNINAEISSKFYTSPNNKDGDYFLREVEKEKSKIINLIEKHNEDLVSLDPSSEESGRIRATVGKANLLINKKFKQFEGLCHDNLEQNKNGVPEDMPPTKNEDLEGFWDMVLIQVEQIHGMFSNLSKNDEPSFEVTAPISTKKPSVTKKSAPPNLIHSKKSNTGSSNSERDEMRRKLLAEKRRAHKNQIGETPLNTANDDSDINFF